MENKIKLYNSQELIGASQNNELIILAQMDAPTRLGLSKLICVDLLMLLGVNGENADPKHHARAITFISTTLQNFAPEEIIFAFHKAIKGEFGFELYQQLNSLVIGRVMREYSRWLTDEKKKREPKPLERIMKEELSYLKEQFHIDELADRLFKDYKAHSSITEKGIDKLYEYCYKANLLPKHSAEFKRDILQKSTPISKAFLMQMYQRNQLTKIELNRELQSVDNGKSIYVHQFSKKIILEQFFKKLIQENKSINDVI